MRFPALHQTAYHEIDVHLALGDDPVRRVDRLTTIARCRIARSEHEDQMDQMSELLSSMPDRMLVRKETVEHPFGTIKSWMGATHFLTKRLKNVSTEMSLHVLAYNLRRVISILGPDKLIAAMKV